jgi:hypothetical protein
VSILHAHALVGLAIDGRHIFGAVLEEVLYFDGLILLHMHDAHNVQEVGEQMQEYSQQKWVEKDEGISTKTTRDEGR